MKQLVMPVLVNSTSTERSYPCILKSHHSGEDPLGKIDIYYKDTGHPTVAMELVLVLPKTDALIAANDVIYCEVTNRIYTVLAICPHDICDLKVGKNFFVNSNKCHKVFARQSQIPIKYVAQFVEEYNARNIKEIEIEMEKYDEINPSVSKYGVIQNAGSWKARPKLTNGCVVIVEKELIHFPYKKEKDKIILYGAGKFQEESLTLDRSKAAILFVELYKFLHFDKESILYTEEEVIDYMAEFAAYVLASYAKDINPISATWWLEQNKKK